MAARVWRTHAALYTYAWWAHPLDTSPQITSGTLVNRPHRSLCEKCGLTRVSHTVSSRGGRQGGGYKAREGQRAEAYLDSRGKEKPAAVSRPSAEADYKPRSNSLISSVVNMPQILARGYSRIIHLATKLSVSY